jgi:hypothetical protein
MDVFERFTDRARRVLVLAQEEARTMDHAFIGTEHLLMGLIAEGDGVAAKALQALGISLEGVRAKVEEGSEETGASGSPPFTPRAKKTLELALREALQLGHSYIGTEHLLLGLVREGEGVAVQILESLGADLVQVRATVIRFMAGYREPGAEGLARSSTATFPGPEAKLVSCSFCGRQPPESGRLVSGTNAFICEQCVRRWARQLTRADVSGSILRPGIGRLRQAVQPTGPPPANQDSARTDIIAAFSGYGTLSEDSQSLPMVDRGENLGATLILARERRRVPETPEVVVIDEIVFTESEHATVWFTVSVTGSPIARPRRGDAVVVNGAWKMARSTFCELMATAGVECPPDTD